MKSSLSIVKTDNKIHGTIIKTGKHNSIRVLNNRKILSTFDFTQKSS